ncbi:PIN domain-containing protein [Serratia fonticola]|uniref:PIN domain-containing protein n=1 Tax=Serratia fonticola TaxID=47917 RepID=A0A542BJV7_SERFO|nr:PIN domain-containing protein [Serratia fonticola]TQI78865.1 PIN domain-containing protein [Serratia fonticola]TQI99112.1 PIN domain-containing protein [Serratia fonticola]TVZ68637.1 PIN domain-containing protein [Serratia fonticola]
MIHTPYPVVLDACVIYPSLLRDLLIRLGLKGLYQPKWTALIEDEWQRNLLANRPDLTQAKISRTSELMNEAVPDAMVTGFEPLIPSITLPDPDDRHVVAAAVRSNAEIIVTANLKDFPQGALDNFGIEALHPDDFITDLFDLNRALVLSAVSEQRRCMKKPPKSVDEYLDALLRQGLPHTVKELSKFHALI